MADDGASRRGSVWSGSIVVDVDDPRFLVALMVRAHVPESVDHSRQIAQQRQQDVDEDAKGAARSLFQANADRRKQNRAQNLTAVRHLLYVEDSAESKRSVCKQKHIKHILQIAS